jgi:hypothetical protein
VIQLPGPRNGIYGNNSCGVISTAGGAKKQNKSEIINSVYQTDDGHHVQFRAKPQKLQKSAVQSGLNRATLKKSPKSLNIASNQNHWELSISI